MIRVDKKKRVFKVVNKVSSTHHGSFRISMSRQNICAKFIAIVHLVFLLSVFGHSLSGRIDVPSSHQLITFFSPPIDSNCLFISCCSRGRPPVFSFSRMLRFSSIKIANRHDQIKNSWRMRKIYNELQYQLSRFVSCSVYLFVIIYDENFFSPSGRRSSEMSDV